MVVHSLTPAFRRERQAGLHEFEASLFYIANSRSARADPVPKNNKMN